MLVGVQGVSICSGLSVTSLFFLNLCFKVHESKLPSNDAFTAVPQIQSLVEELGSLWSRKKITVYTSHINFTFKERNMIFFFLKYLFFLTFFTLSLGSVNFSLFKKGFKGASPNSMFRLGKFELFLA